jgi:hypothetical protein
MASRENVFLCGQPVSAAKLSTLPADPVKLKTYLVSFSAVNDRACSSSPSMASTV